MANLVGELLYRLKDKIPHIQEVNHWIQIYGDLTVKRSTKGTILETLLELLDYVLDIEKLKLDPKERISIEAIYNEDPIALIDSIEIDLLDWSPTIHKHISRVKNSWESWNFSVYNDSWEYVSEINTTHNNYYNKVEKIIKLRKAISVWHKINIIVIDIFGFESHIQTQI